MNVLTLTVALMESSLEGIISVIKENRKVMNHVSRVRMHD